MNNRSSFLIPTLVIGKRSIEEIMTIRIYKERRIYFSGNCTKCGKPFQSFKRSRIKHGFCRNCRKNSVSKDQVSIFDPSTMSVGGVR